MAGHDLEVLSAAESMAAFRSLLEAEQALFDRLTATLEEHRQLLPE